MLWVHCNNSELRSSDSKVLMNVATWILIGKIFTSGFVDEG